MKITLTGIIVFVALVAGFFLWIGGVPDTDGLFRRGTTRAWLQCALLFIAGAATACFGDKEYGMFPPTSLRWLYILFGIGIMVIAGLWMHTLKETWSNAKSTSMRQELVGLGDQPA